MANKRVTKKQTRSDNSKGHTGVTPTDHEATPLEILLEKGNQDKVLTQSDITAHGTNPYLVYHNALNEGKELYYAAD